MNFTKNLTDAAEKALRQKSGVRKNAAKKKKLASYKLRFNSRCVQYNSANAAFLSTCSGTAYKKKYSATSEMEKWGLTRFNFFSKGSTQCFVASNNRIVVIAFRGTETNRPEDILADLDIKQVEAFGGNVHEGFYNAYKLVGKSVLNAIRKHVDNKQTIWFTGHSLGGALAAICAMDCNVNGFRVNGIYTFGQPRIGAPNFCQRYNKSLGEKHFRIAQKDDVVPRIPMKTIKTKNLKLEYGDVGEIIYVVPPSTLVRKYKRSNSELNILANIVKAGNAHSCSNYIKVMKKNIDFDPFTAEVQEIKENDILDQTDLDEDVKALLAKVDQTVSGTKDKVTAIVDDVSNGVDEGLKKIGKFFKF